MFAVFQVWNDDHSGLLTAPGLSLGGLVGRRVGRMMAAASITEEWRIDNQMLARALCCDICDRIREDLSPAEVSRPLVAGCVAAS